MAGGGVGEAMLIGAAVGAGTGGVMSAVKDEDPLQGALLGAALGAAGGGVGSALGGAGSAAAQAGTQAATGTGSSLAGSGFQNALGQAVAQQAGEQAATTGAASLLGQAGTSATQMTPGLTQAALSGGSNVGAMAGQGAMSIPGVGAAGGNLAGTGTTLAGATSGATPGGVADLAQWGQAGRGAGFAPSLTNAQAYGAGLGGAAMGLVGQAAQNQDNMAPEPATYTGPLSQFKYSPSTFKPSIAPGYADGGIAALDQSTYPQSQVDRTQFAVPSQMPISREVIGADFDRRIDPFTGDMPRYAHGGISSLGSYSDGGRMLRGPGDGMSDDIPGVIGGKQPARLADGEFVVPADVVSHLGNGSTDAGAKKLYGMMDNVRKARTGSKKQGRQIKADKYVPGMKKGGIAYYDEGGDTNSEAAPAEQPAASPATVPGQGAVATGFQATGYEPSQQYSPYTMANRPSSAQPQYYGDIYQGYYPDYSAPGYTLAGNLGQWSNVAGEQARAAQPASQAQQITQAYLQNLGRAPEQSGMDFWMQQPALQESLRDIATSREAANINAVNFDPQYYLQTNPDVAKNWTLSPIEHYLRHGFKEGRAGSAPKTGGISSLV